jgi:hypothetical protein
VALTAELAEGWQPVFFHPGRADEVWAPLGQLDAIVQADVGIGNAEMNAPAARRELAL